MTGTCDKTRDKIMALFADLSESTIDYIVCNVLCLVSSIILCCVSTGIYYAIINLSRRNATKFMDQAVLNESFSIQYLLVKYSKHLINLVVLPKFASGESDMTFQIGSCVYKTRN